MAARLTRGRLHRLPSRAALLAGAVVLVALAIVFPDGRLPGGRARTWVALASVPAAAVCALVLAGPAADADPGRLSTALARVLAELEEDARAAR